MPILARGANPNAQDARGWTALRHVVSSASESSDAFALFVLLEAGADPTIADNEGSSPLPMILQQREFQQYDRYRDVLSRAMKAANQTAPDA
jgi:hypothetical protein